MKITVDYNDNISTTVLNVKNVKYIGDFVMRIYFSSDEEILIDFKPFLEQSGHPSIKKYLDEEKFMDYQIVNGNLNWNDYDLIFPIADLYENNIQKNR